MQSLPLVSIIVPVYGVEKYIERCTQSLFNQTYNNYEIIFVDDCTPDNSVCLIRQVAKEENFNRFKIIHHKENMGLAQTRITGIASAIGKYYMFVDSDDWIESNMVSELIEKALESKADIIVGGHNNVGSKKTISVLPKHLDKEKFIKNILLKSIPGSIWGKLYHSRLFIEHRDLFNVERIGLGEDYVMVPRLMYYANGIEYVNRALYNYNLCNTNSYIHNISKKSMKSMVLADKILSNFFQDKFSAELIDLMKLRTKAGLLKQSNYKLYTDISKLYLREQKQNWGLLGIKDKLLLMICGKYGKGVDSLLSYVVHIYLK